MYDLVKGMRARGVPIDGVGLQLHVQHTYSSFDGVAANMARLAALGLQVHVTELDVSCSLTEATCSWGDEDAEKQAKIYASLLQVRARPSTATVDRSRPHRSRTPSRSAWTSRHVDRSSRGVSLISTLGAARGAGG